MFPKLNMLSFAPASTQHVETEQPSVPPWMKELRRANRPVPTLPSHVANNNGPAPPTETTPSPDSRDHAHKVSNLNDSNLSRQEVFQSPVFNNSIETRSKGREVLAPLKRSSVDNSAHSGMIDNRLATPSYLGTTNGTGPELTSNRNVLPPLKSTSQSSTSQDDQGRICLSIMLANKCTYPLGIHPIKYLSPSQFSSVLKFTIKDPYHLHQGSIL